MKKVTNEILFFSSFLNLNFDLISNSIKQKKFDDDYEYIKLLEIFIQANWEIIVEMIICDKNEILEYYDSGADFYDFSYRVTSPKRKANTKIVVKSDSEIYDYLSETPIIIDNLDFIKFISYKNGCYYNKPEFNYILAENSNGDKYLFEKKSVDYFHVLI